MDDRIDLLAFLKIMKKRLVTIMLTTICIFAFTALATQFFIKPTYEATEYLLVGKLKRDESYYGETRDINMLLASTIDYIKSPIILNVITKEYGLKKDDIEDMIAVKNNRDSQIIHIIVREKSPEVAQQIAYMIGETTVKKMNESLQVDEIQVLSTSTEDIAIKQIGNIVLNMAIGFIVGLFFGIGLAMLKDYLDDSLKDVKELEVLLGLEVLGELDLKSKKRTFTSKHKKEKRAAMMKNSKGGEVSV